jgi:hypothetical protein
VGECLLLLLFLLFCLTPLAPLIQSGDGGLKARRVKSFAEALVRHPLLLAASQQQGLGAVSLVFSPDSSRLAIATFDGHVVVVNVSAECEVARVFTLQGQQARRPGGRAVTGTERPKANGHHHVNGGGDVDMGSEETEDDDDDDDTEENEGLGSDGPSREKTTSVVVVVAMAISSDGQWLAVADSGAGLHVYNLDSLQVCVGPSLPPHGHHGEVLTVEDERTTVSLVVAICPHVSVLPRLCPVVPFHARRRSARQYVRGVLGRVWPCRTMGAWAQQCVVVVVIDYSVTTRQAA